MTIQLGSDRGRQDLTVLFDYFVHVNGTSVADPIEVHNLKIIDTIKNASEAITLDAVLTKLDAIFEYKLDKGEEDFKSQIASTLQGRIET